jgi:hypothetical protein
MENTSVAQTQNSQKGEEIQSTIEEVEEEIEEGERT